MLVCCVFLYVGSVMLFVHIHVCVVVLRGACLSVLFCVVICVCLLWLRLYVVSVLSFVYVHVCVWSDGVRVLGYCSELVLVCLLCFLVCDAYVLLSVYIHVCVCRLTV